MSCSSFKVRMCNVEVHSTNFTVRISTLQALLLCDLLHRTQVLAPDTRRYKALYWQRISLIFCSCMWLLIESDNIYALALSIFSYRSVKKTLLLSKIKLLWNKHELTDSTHDLNMDWLTQHMITNLQSMYVHTFRLTLYVIDLFIDSSIYSWLFIPLWDGENYSYVVPLNSHWCLASTQKWNHHPCLLWWFLLH